MIMKKSSTARDKLITSLWIILGIILLVMIYLFKETPQQNMVDKLVHYYWIGSIVIGVFRFIKKSVNK
ncbi:MAG: hypothetical protein Q4B85_02240 [Lachnospiraceae bacterium]|nr:hypothetical protein [Lachnospiraceae bacterium]